MPELTFPRVPDELAIRAIERRGGKFVPSTHWWNTWQDEHQTAFTVAQSAGFDILGDIYSAIQTAMTDGVAYETFAKNLTPILEKKGWWGKSPDGVQLGSPSRLKTIFNQNIRVSAAQGDWERQQEGKASRPYLRYTALVDGRTRPLHKSWHGVILPIDHPWWETHYPPNGWNCRCKALSVDDGDLEFYGWQVSPEAPDDGERQWLNPKTGETLLVPNGIDPGWAYNPGAVDQLAHARAINQEKRALLQKLIDTFKNILPPRQAPIKPVSTEAELANEIKTHLSMFTRNGPVTSVIFNNEDYFMATTSRGEFWISRREYSKCNNFSAARELMSAWNNIAKGKPLSFNEEYAIESLWHETVHNRQTLTDAGGKDSQSLMLMETVTQWTARRTYQTLLEHLGAKPEHQADILLSGYGYRRWVNNFDSLLLTLGVKDDVQMLAAFEDIIRHCHRKRYRKEITAYLQKNAAWKVTKKAINEILSKLDEPDSLTFIRLARTKLKS